MLQARAIHLFNAHLPLKYAGVVDQRRQAPQCLIAGFEQQFHFLLDGDVRGCRYGAAARGFDPGHDRLGRGAVAPVIDTDGIAAPRSQPRRPS